MGNVTRSKLQFLRKYIVPGHIINDSGTCYICEDECVTVLHHAIPRSYGGEKSSILINLCPNCHKNLHAVEASIGDLPAKKQIILPYLKQVFHYVDDLTHAVECIIIILIARDVIKKDPKKSSVTSFRLSYREKNMLKKLKNVYPKKSQEQILRMSLKAFYEKHFTSVKDE